MPKKIIYEENPWDDVAGLTADDFNVVHGVLPPASEIRKAKIVVDGNEIIVLHLSPNDIESLHNIAQRDGVSSTDLATSVVHKFISDSANQ
ncbi:MAG: hypothetical protein ABL867_09030 [Rickettsiales bacterium]